MKTIGKFLVAFCLCACGKLPPNAPTDAEEALACVLADVTTQRPVDDCVQKYGQKLISDILALLGDSSQFATDQPAAYKFTMSLQAK